MQKFSGEVDTTPQSPDPTPLLNLRAYGAQAQCDTPRKKS